MGKQQVNGLVLEGDVHPRCLCRLVNLIHKAQYVIAHYLGVKPVQLVFDFETVAAPGSPSSKSGKPPMGKAFKCVPDVGVDAGLCGSLTARS